MPPVTELRSPPDSRITGADSPVIADSSTVAMPSTMSPSPGITCPASTTTRSPTRSVGAGHRSSRAPPARRLFRCSRRAVVSVRVRRRLSAWALPRPSATASARLAKRTVNHSQTAISQEKTLGSTTASAVTRTEPTQTTNMTGLRSWVRGSSLRSASGSERQSWRGGNAPAPTVRRSVRRAGADGRRSTGRGGGGGHARASAIGPRASAGKKVRAATRTTVPQTRTPNRARGGQGAGAGFDALLRGERPGEREHGQDRHEPAEQHRQPERGLEERAGHGQPGEGAAVVVPAEA